MAQLETQLMDSSDQPVLRVEGELDVATAEQLREALLHAIATHPEVVVDMADMSFVDACGLRVILQTAASMDGSGPLTLLDAQRVERLLAVVGISDPPDMEFRTRATHG